MKKIKYIALMLLCLLAVTACGDDEEDTAVKYAEWKLENDEAFQAIEMDPEYTELKSLGNDGSIYYKVLKQGTSREPIYYTDSVRVYYTGWLYTGDEFDSVEPPYKDPVVMRLQATPGSGAVVAGFALALEYMHIGDRWDIWIPQQLGYGATGNPDPYTNTYSILPYTTLHFQVEVVDIIRNGVTITQ